MIKLIPIEMTKRELNQAVMDGRRFTLENTYVHEKDVIHWDDKGTDYTVRKGIQPWNWRGFKYLHEITESHWYDNISKGNPAACTVWNQDEPPELAYIYRTVAKSEYASIDGRIWDYAELLTPAQLYQEPV